MKTGMLKPPPPPKEDLSLKGLGIEELEPLLKSEGGPRYASRQLLNWLYRRNAGSFDEMTDVGRELRKRLARKYRISEGAATAERIGEDGTTKLLIEMTDGAKVECVIIPESDRSTLCVSSQVGCARKCLFCATGRMGLVRNLTAGEIVEQMVIASRRTKITNVVFMGMGEPFDNYDSVRRAVLRLTHPHAFGLGHRHVTISTAGVVPGIRRMARDLLPARLTVSLTAPDDATRSKLIPLNRTWNVGKLVEACQEYTELTRRRVTLAYVLLKGVNDSSACAQRLAALAGRIRAKINLIPYNQTDMFERPSEETTLRFQRTLKERGIVALYRRARGAGISAACGQLAAS